MATQRSIEVDYLLSTHHLGVPYRVHEPSVDIDEYGMSSWL